MFTKYTSIKVPENYGGSRFTKAPMETEMKTHRPEVIASPSTPVKTSVSPFFQSAHKSEIPLSIAEDLEDTSYEETHNDADNELTAADDESASQEDKATTIDENVSPLTSHAGIKELSRLLEKIKSDDLLLLTLILLLAKDGGDEGMDGIILLALLLLFR